MSVKVKENNNIKVLAGIDGSPYDGTVDSSLSTTSTNAIENSAVNRAVNNIPSGAIPNEPGGVQRGETYLSNEQRECFDSSVSADTVLNVPPSNVTPKTYTAGTGVTVTGNVITSNYATRAYQRTQGWYDTQAGYPSTEAINLMNNKYYVLQQSQVSVSGTNVYITINDPSLGSAFGVTGDTPSIVDHISFYNPEATPIRVPFGGFVNYDKRLAIRLVINGRDYPVYSNGPHWSYTSDSAYKLWRPVDILNHITSGATASTDVTSWVANNYSYSDPKTSLPLSTVLKYSPSLINYRASAVTSNFVTYLLPFHDNALYTTETQMENNLTGIILGRRAAIELEYDTIWNAWFIMPNSVIAQQSYTFGNCIGAGYDYQTAHPTADLPSLVKQDAYVQYFADGIAHWSAQFPTICRENNNDSGVSMGPDWISLPTYVSGNNLQGGCQIIAQPYGAASTSASAAYYNTGIGIGATSGTINGLLSLFKDNYTVRIQRYSSRYKAGVTVNCRCLW